ncbi:hypothetical protein JTB14_008374 [Gonioctena quinquepunctata]|nr:hypothetical protein JTB14_008374 [Gonioctena quinquepunctata]
MSTGEQNVNESGFSLNVLDLKGKHRVRFAASKESVRLKTQHKHPALRSSAFPGSIVDSSESDYINTELFVEWLNHLIKSAKLGKNDKCLLLLDGHTIHSKNLETLKLARYNGIILLQLPDHTTHRLQPLDVGKISPSSKVTEKYGKRVTRGAPKVAVSTENSHKNVLEEKYTLKAKKKTKKRATPKIRSKTFIYSQLK